MKIIVSQVELSKSLSLVNRAVPSRPTHPVLANILLRTEGDTQIILTAFDLSLGIQVNISAEILQGGEVAIPSKLFVDIVSRLPEGDITLITEDTNDGIVVTIKPQKGKYQIRGMDAEEFPVLPAIISKSAEISAAALIEGLKACLFAVSSDEAKQILTGVHLTLNQDTLEFAATDGHRLSVLTTDNEKPIEDSIKVTIPAKALRELQKMLAGHGDEIVNVCLDEGQVVFEWQGKQLTSRTLEGQYPAYNQLIPKEFERTVVLEKKWFISVLERISVLADQKNNIVKLSVDSDNQEITISCEAQDVGSGTETISALISGEDIEIAFNVKYLLEGLRELPAQEIRMDFNQPLTPVIFTPISGAKMTYLSMPIQVRN